LLLIMLSSFVVAAPPSFHLFSGYVTCADGSFVDNHVLDLTVYNGSNVFTQTTSISNGFYSVLVDADVDYLVNFSAGGFYLDQFVYQAYGFSEDTNFSLDASHSFCFVAVPTCTDGIQNQGETGVDCGGPCTACSVAPVTGGGGSGGGGGGSGGTTPVVNTSNQTTGTIQSWDLTGTEVNMDQTETEEVISVGGDYNLVLDGTNTPFSIYSVTEGTVTIDIDGQTYVVPLEGSQEFTIGDYEFQVSYLDSLNGRAKVLFKKISLRGVTAYSSKEVIYFIIGAVIIGAGLFFGERVLMKKNKTNSSVKPSNVLDKNQKNGT